MEINIADIINTLIGVFAGGIISIITSNIVNKKNIKNQFIFDLLSEVKILLNEWNRDLLNHIDEFHECKTIKQCKGYESSNSKNILVQKINANQLILSCFKDEFTKLLYKELDISLQYETSKMEIYELSLKYNTEEMYKLMEYEDVHNIIQNYSKDIMTLIHELQSLIAKIDNYIYEKIL